MNHDTKPERRPLTEESLKKMKEISETTYYQHIKHLGTKIKDKVVVNSTAGHTGYLLYFDDGTWLLCFLDGEQFNWKFGDKPPTTQDLSLLHNPQHLDGQKPLRSNIPYAHEECNIKNAALQTHGKPVMGVSIGLRSFGVCFPSGYELEAHVFTHANQLTLRVFWEQW